MRDQCDYPEKARCSPKGDNNSPETSTNEPVKTTESPVPSCNGDSQFLADAKNCSRYYNCIGGTAFVMYCPEGYYWNEDKKQCDVAGMSRCLNPDLVIGDSVPVDNEPTTTTEVPATTTTTTTTEAPTTTKAPTTTTADVTPRCDGSVQFLGDPTDCSRYYNCIAGAAFPMECPKDAFWNEDKSQCDVAAKSRCLNPQLHNGDAAIVDGNDALEATTKTTTADSTPRCGGSAQFLADPTNCSRYYNCIGGTAFVMNCPEGYFWNEDKQQCDVPAMARCYNPEPVE